MRGRARMPACFCGCAGVCVFICLGKGSHLIGVCVCVCVCVCVRACVCARVRAGVFALPLHSAETVMCNAEPKDVPAARATTRVVPQLTL